jgi:lysylphosphatidylglycerol synthetase-like protein (DUF2156 family)
MVSLPLDVPGHLRARSVPARRPWPRTAGIAVAVAALLGCAPAPTAAAQTLRAALAGAVVSGADLTGPVVALLSLVAWCLAAWLAVTAALAGCSRVPGATGRITGAVLRRVAPATVRRAVEIALGLTIATGAACAPASASSSAPGSGAVLQQAPHDEAPAAAALVTAPSLDWPGAPAPPGAGAVVVAPGDTLWHLAEHALGDGATPAQVALAWPAWWSANRHVIGEDPDLLRPGQRLAAPASPAPPGPPPTR